jgi:hypothetical protein
MKIYFLAVGLLCVQSMQSAAVVTCTEPGFTQTITNGTCIVPGDASGGGLQYWGVTSSRISNGDLFVEAHAEILFLPEVTDLSKYPMTANSQWNDYFDLPVSRPDDVLKITAFGAGFGGPGSIQVGSIFIESEGISSTQFCDESYSGNPACTFQSTELAAMVPFVKLVGSTTYECNDASCHPYENQALDEVVQIQRFFADGVTSDPFTVPPLARTPEAGTGTIFCAGLLFLAALQHLKSRRGSAAYLRRPRS